MPWNEIFSRNFEHGISDLFRAEVSVLDKPSHFTFPFPLKLFFGFCGLFGWGHYPALHFRNPAFRSPRRINRKLLKVAIQEYCALEQKPTERFRWIRVRALMLERAQNGPVASRKIDTPSKTLSSHTLSALLPKKNLRFLTRRGRRFAARHPHNNRRNDGQLLRNTELGLYVCSIQRRDCGTDYAGAESHGAGGEDQILRRQPAIGSDEDSHGLAANDYECAGIIEHVEIRACEHLERVSPAIKMGPARLLQKKRFCKVRKALERIRILDDRKYPGL